MAKPSIRDNFIPLSEAAWKFAPRRLKEEYWELEEVPAPELPDAIFTNLALAISAQFQHAFRTGPAINGMEKHVAEMLRSGDLEARGLQTAPNRGATQEPIQHFYFLNPKINWGKNIVESLGYRFEAVEVRRAQKDGGTSKQQTAEQPSLASPARVSVGRKTGRPSKVPAVMDAIQELAQRGHDFQNSLRKESCSQILHFLTYERGQSTARSFSPRVLNRCINEHLEACNTAAKPAKAQK